MVPLRLCHLSPEFPLSGQELLLMMTRTTLDWKAHGDLDPQSGQKTLTEDVLDILWPLTLNRCTCPEDKPDCLHDGQKDSTRSASCPEGQTLLVHKDSLRDRASPHRDTQMDQRHFPGNRLVLPQSSWVCSHGSAHPSLPFTGPRSAALP